MKGGFRLRPRPQRFRNRRRSQSTPRSAKSENAGMCRKMPFMDGHYLVNDQSLGQYANYERSNHEQQQNAQDWVALGSGGYGYRVYCDAFGLRRGRVGGPGEKSAAQPGCDRRRGWRRRREERRKETPGRCGADACAKPGRRPAGPGRSKTVAHFRRFGAAAEGVASLPDPGRGIRFCTGASAPAGAPDLLLRKSI